MRYPRRRACRAAARRYLDPDTPTDVREAALEELMGFVEGGDYTLRHIAARAILVGGRSPTRLRADERKAFTQLKEQEPRGAPDSAATPAV